MGFDLREFLVLINRFSRVLQWQQYPAIIAKWFLPRHGFADGRQPSVPNASLKLLTDPIVIRKVRMWINATCPRSGFSQPLHSQSHHFATLVVRIGTGKHE